MHVSAEFYIKSLIKLFQSFWTSDLTATFIDSKIELKIYKIVKIADIDKALKEFH